MEIYVLLVIILLVGLWVFFLGREVSSGWMRLYYVGESFTRGYQAGFFDRMITLFLGLGWLVLFVVSEELMRRQPTQARVLTVFSRFMGTLCLLAFVLDILLVVFVTGAAAVNWIRWLVIITELVLGGCFAFLGWSKRSPWRERQKPGVLDAGKIG